MLDTKETERVDELITKALGAAYNKHKLTLNKIEYMDYYQSLWEIFLKKYINSDKDFEVAMKGFNNGLFNNNWYITDVTRQYNTWVRKKDGDYTKYTVYTNVAHKILTNSSRTVELEEQVEMDDKLAIYTKVRDEVYDGLPQKAKEIVDHYYKYCYGEGIKKSSPQRKKFLKQKQIQPNTYNHVLWHYNQKIKQAVKDVLEGIS